MAGELQLGGSTVATHTGSGASAVVTIDNGVKFPAGTVIGTSYYVAPAGTWEITSTETNWWEFTVTKKQSSSHIVIMMTTVVRVDGTSSGGAGLYLGVRRSTSSTPVTTSDTLVLTMMTETTFLSVICGQILISIRLHFQSIFMIILLAQLHIIMGYF